METTSAVLGDDRRSGTECFRTRTQGAARYSYSYSNVAMNHEAIFDHDRLDVYRLSIDCVAESFAIAKDLSGAHCHARDQWLRAAQSIPLDIAEGNGKRSVKDRSRFFDIARGSALECATIQDAMLTRLISRLNTAAEAETSYNTAIDYEYEYRDAEYEYDDSRKPEQCRAHGARLASFNK